MHRLCCVFLSAVEKKQVTSETKTDAALTLSARLSDSVKRKRNQSHFFFFQVHGRTNRLDYHFFASCYFVCYRTRHREQFVLIQHIHNSALSHSLLQASYQIKRETTGPARLLMAAHLASSSFSCLEVLATVTSSTVVCRRYNKHRSVTDG